MTVTWQISGPDLIAIIGAALLLYGRLVALETRMQPIWEWWSDTFKPRGDRNKRDERGAGVGAGV